jgi:hypothetical protein
MCRLNDFFYEQLLDARRNSALLAQLVERQTLSTAVCSKSGVSSEGYVFVRVQLVNRFARAPLKLCQTPEIELVLDILKRSPKFTFTISVSDARGLLGSQAERCTHGHKQVMAVTPVAWRRRGTETETRDERLPPGQSRSKEDSFCVRCFPCVRASERGRRSELRRGKRFCWGI